MYHWSMLDTVATADGDRALLYGWAWLFAVGELLVGGEARRLETSADYQASSSLSRNETSVVGLAVLGAARVARRRRAEGRAAHAANTTARAADAADNATAGAAATAGADGDDGDSGGGAAGATGDAPPYVLTAAFNSMCYNASSCAEAGVGHKEVELVIRLGDYFASGAGGDDDDVIAVEQYYIDCRTRCTTPSGATSPRARLSRSTTRTSTTSTR